MILHLFHDEKVCNRLVANFREALPEQNRFICFCKKGNFTYVKYDSEIIYIDKDDISIDSAILKGVDKILIHYLDVTKIDFIDRYIPKESGIRIYWALWGGDLYNKILAIKGYDIYYEKEYANIFLLRFRVKEFLKKVCFRNTYKKYVDKAANFIAERIDYVLTSKYEYDILVNYIGCKIKTVLIDKGPLYYPLEEVLGSLFNGVVNGNGIMLGNSASFTNNHLYTMDFLSKLNTDGRKINVPLSYGGSLQYREHVREIGYKHWKESFNPIENFMPLDEYNKLMLSNSVYIYGNWRQEAMGNIVVALYLGAKVFISSKSPLVGRFNDYGVKVYLLENMTQKDIDTPESEDVVNNNRKTILTIYSKDAILKRIIDIFG